MILDNEQQREDILRMIEHLTFNGKDVDEVYYLKQAVLNAGIQTE